MEKLFLFFLRQGGDVGFHIFFHNGVLMGAAEFHFGIYLVEAGDAARDYSFG